MSKLEKIVEILLYLFVYISTPYFFVSCVKKENIITEPFTNIDQMEVVSFLIAFVYVLFADKILFPFICRIYDIIRAKIIKKRLEKNVDKYIERKFE